MPDEGPKQNQMFYRTFKYRLRPTQAQASTMLGWIGHCRGLYNAALEQRRDAHRKAGVCLSRYTQQKELTELRKADPDFSAMPVQVCRSALARLDHAFEDFKRRLKEGDKKPGYPRFKGRDRLLSFTFGKENGPRPVDLVHDDQVLVPKLGPVKFGMYRPTPEHQPYEAVIKFDGKKWWVCLGYEFEDVPKRTVSKAIGIDLGLTTFATLSNGEEVENPRFFKTAQDAITRKHQALMRKKFGSKSRARAKQQHRAAHAHVRYQRQEFVRKLVADLFRKYQLVAYEELGIQRMLTYDQYGKFLGKSIHDAGWRVFIKALVSKAECAGYHAVGVEPRGTTQECSGCGEVVPKTLKQRKHECPHCGLVLGRDHNAALNVLRLGQSLAPVDVVTNHGGTEVLGQGRVMNTSSSSATEIES